MISSGLLPLLGHPLVAGMCKIAHELEQTCTHDYKDYMLRMLQVRRTAVLLPVHVLSCRWCDTLIAHSVEVCTYLQQRSCCPDCHNPHDCAMCRCHTSDVV
jgi:hypothetical protein